MDGDEQLIASVVSVPATFSLRLISRHDEEALHGEGQLRGFDDVKNSPLVLVPGEVDEFGYEDIRF